MTFYGIYLLFTRLMLTYTFVRSFIKKHFYFIIPTNHGNTNNEKSHFSFLLVNIYEGAKVI